MSKITELLRDLSGFGSAFTDVRLVAGEPVKIKTPMGWAAIETVESTSEEGADRHAESGSMSLTMQDFKDFIGSFDKQSHQEISHAGQLDRAIALNDQYRLRVNVFRTGGGKGTGMVCRFQPTAPIQFKDTGLPFQLLQTVLEARSGLFMVCGRTGAGKTSTLASLIEEINKRLDTHIVTIEEPIEYIHVPKAAMFTQREVGVDVPSFAKGVHAAMRQAPDVIMIGEIRDRDTAEAALRAALSGHLVLATIHGDRAVSAIERMFSYFPEEHGFVSLALRSSLIASVAQVIMPTLDATGYAVAAEILNGRAEQVQAAIADTTGLRKLEAQLLGSQIQGSNHFNLHLRQLVQKQTIAAPMALSMSPARDELARLLDNEALTLG